MEELDEQTNCLNTGEKASDLQNISRIIVLYLCIALTHVRVMENENQAIKLQT